MQNETEQRSIHPVLGTIVNTKANIAESVTKLTLQNLFFLRYNSLIL